MQDLYISDLTLIFVIKFPESNPTRAANEVEGGVPPYKRDVRGAAVGAAGAERDAALRARRPGRPPAGPGRVRAADD